MRPPADATPAVPEHLPRALRRALQRGKAGTARAREVRVPSVIAAGIRRAERERRADVIARPMRNLFALLAQGEVYEIDGQAHMWMPEIDTAHARKASEWVVIPHAVRGWIDLWTRIAPDLRLYHMQVLADRLEQGKPLTARLVAQALDEFEQTIARIGQIEHGKLVSTITTQEIAWEMERLQGGGAA